MTKSIIKSPELYIDPKDSFKNDVLQRKGSAKILTEFVKNTECPFVLAIDSPWGTGKTTFLKMWEGMLCDEKIPTLYFNAWENDFSDDPFVSLVGEIGRLSKNNKANKTSEIYKSIKENAGKIAPILAKHAMKGALDYVGISVEDIAKDITAVAEKFTEEAIEKHEERKKTIVSFKTELTKFIKSLSANPNDDSPNSPLVFIIDELDRCRPTYAIELLERVKHLFNVNNIIFVLAVDKKQLGHSLRTVYGLRMDVDGYLRRFIDIEYHIPLPNRDLFVHELIRRFQIDEYIQKRIRLAGTNEQFKHDIFQEKDQLFHVFARLFDVFGFSFRQQEQCFAELSIVYRVTANDYMRIPLLSTLIVLRASNPSLYEKYINDEVHADKVIDYISKTTKGKKFLDTTYGLHVIDGLYNGRPNRKDGNDLINRYEEMYQHSSDEYEKSQIANKMNSLRWSIYPNSIPVIIKRLEFSENFFA